MTTMPDQITGGVDTHLDVHVAAALNAIGGQVSVQSFPADGPGYRRLLEWLQSFGTVALVGVEGTGSYGAGLTLHDKGMRVGRSIGPTARSAGGPASPTRSTPVEAPRAALSGRAKGLAKTRNGSVEAIRVLRVARCSARKDRVRGLNQLHALISTAPEELRSELRGLTISKLVHKTAVCGRISAPTSCAASLAGARHRGRGGRDRWCAEPAGGRDRTRSRRPVRGWT